jgi:AbrB family looped-hinge helix DNA binding protein
MQTTRLTSKGQLVIPKAVRDRMRVVAGTEFKVTQSGQRIVLEAIRRKGRKLGEWPGFGRKLKHLDDREAFAPVDIGAA